MCEAMWEVFYILMKNAGRSREYCLFGKIKMEITNLRDRGQAKGEFIVVPRNGYSNDLLISSSFLSG